MQRIALTLLYVCDPFRGTDAMKRQPRLAVGGGGGGGGMCGVCFIVDSTRFSASMSMVRL